jgi:hypothetical protein
MEFEGISPAGGGEQGRWGFFCIGSRDEVMETTASARRKMTTRRKRNKVAVGIFFSFYLLT